MASTSTHVPKERDLSAHCRVCLQLPEEDQVLDVNLIYDEEEQLSYYNCFVICTQIDLDDGVGMPHNLCKLCGIELQMAYDFYKKVDTARRCLQEMEDNACKEDLAEMDGFQTVEQCDKLIIEDPEVLEDDMTSEAAEEAQDTLSPDAQDTLSPDAQDALSQDVQDAEEKLIEHDNYMEIEDFDSIEGLEEREEEAEEHIAESNDEFIEDDAISENVPEKSNQSRITRRTIKHESIELEDLYSEVFEELEENSSSQQSQTDALELLHKPQLPATNGNDGPKRKRKRAPTIRVGPPFKCEQCDHLSPSRTLLASHRYRKHRVNENPCLCPKCGKAFDHHKKLERHLKRPTCNAYPEFICEYCSKKCVGHSNYHIHLRFHKKQYPYVCHLCAKSFMLATHLNNHVKTKHENMRFFCEFAGCGKKFQTAHALKVHTYTHRKNKMPYKCEYCERLHPTKGRLRWHISRTHGIEHTLEYLDCMLVAEQISMKPQLKPQEPDDLTDDSLVTIHV